MKPIIVVGTQRSGTTLLRTMLAQHSQLAVHPQEPQFFLELYKQFGTQPVETQRLIDHVVGHKYRLEEIDPAGLHHHLPNTTATLSQLIQAYFAVWLNGDTSRRPVIKHPHLVFYLDGILELFGDAQIINLVRDPRANVSSQRARWSHLSVWECASLWHKAIQASQQFAQQHPHTLLSIRYEDLVLEPTATLQKVCEFLSLSYEPAMETFNLPFRTFSAGGKTKDVTFTQPDPSRLTRWKTQLSPLDVRLIEKRCHPAMAQWHYSLTRPSTPFLPYAGRYLVEQARYVAKQAIRSI